ncbi:VanZ family protein [Solibacillus sp. CAU 1738]|uniref:VanZ family protein n=1 Tax=Solibacillus sp. CAU 1738 TaxID=3140363 RepID=UPI003260409A
MRLQEIIGILRGNIFFAFSALIVLSILFLIAYYVIYKKFLGEKKGINKKRFLLVGLFLSYLLMVLGVTFLNRGANNFSGSVNLSLFSSYREAWYLFSVRHWQFIYFNILMFVPFGMILPLLHSRFQKVRWTIGLAMIFTLSIETVQYITGFGIFEFDDLFNNVLGAVIGYGFTMGVMAYKSKGIKQSIAFFSPFLLVILFSFGMIAYYETKEFGNLSIVPSSKTNMKNTTVTTSIQLNNERDTAIVYKAAGLTNESAEQFVKNFFEGMQLDSSNMEIISYQNEAIYWLGENRTHNMWVDFLNGSYRYQDFSSFDENVKPQVSDENTLKNRLKEFDITIPQQADFKQLKTGTYEWTVDKLEVDNQLIDGSLKVDYYDDDTVKGFDHQIVTYDKAKDIQLKGELAAYEEILAGNFKYNENKRIKTVQIEQVDLSYQLDSKGFYQPVYAFSTLIDGKEVTILVPGIL